MSTPVTYTTTAGDMVDLIAFQFYGTSVGTTEAILAANPGLADYDILPAGIVITLPPAPTPAAATVTSLWT